MTELPATDEFPRCFRHKMGLFGESYYLRCMSRDSICMVKENGDVELIDFTFKECLSFCRSGEWVEFSEPKQKPPEPEPPKPPEPWWKKYGKPQECS